MNRKFKELYYSELEKRQGFIFHNNYNLIELNDKSCTVEGIIDKNSLNPFGIVHGGYLFGLADTCAGILVNSKGEDAVTTNSSINYLHPATGKKIVANSKIVKKGSNIIVCDCEIYNEKNKIVAKAILEYFIIKDKNN